jgi:hypothetical protein
VCGGGLGISALSDPSGVRRAGGRRGGGGGGGGGGGAHLTPSTTRFATCGDTRHVKATPRTCFTKPSSTTLQDLSSRTTGHVKRTSPPPAGAQPRLRVSSARPSRTPKYAICGRCSSRSASTPWSTSSPVMPRRVSASGLFPKGARGSTPSRYHPTPRAVPQSCSTAPPTKNPGAYFSDVPVSFISTVQPLLSLDSSRRKPASKSRSPGAPSRARMSVMITRREERVARMRRRRKSAQPRKRSGGAAVEAIYATKKAAR